MKVTGTMSLESRLETAVEDLAELVGDVFRAEASYTLNGGGGALKKQIDHARKRLDRAIHEAVTIRVEIERREGK